MRGIVAKRFRREAENQTVGKPSVSYMNGSPPLFAKAESGAVVRVQPGVPTKLGDCTRKLYKRLKHDG